MKTETDIRQKIHSYELMAKEAERTAEWQRADRCRHVIVALNWVLTGTIGKYEE